MDQKHPPAKVAVAYGPPAGGPPSSATISNALARCIASPSSFEDHHESACGNAAREVPDWVLRGLSCSSHVAERRLPPAPLAVPLPTAPAAGSRRPHPASLYTQRS